MRRIHWAGLIGDRGKSEGHPMICGLGSVVGIATGYGLDGPGIESQ